MPWSLSHILRLGLVPLRGAATIAGAKTFSGAVTMQSTLAGARRPVLTRGAGSSQPGADESGAYLVTDGALTIPTTAGVEYVIELGGDHDITFNSTTVDVSAESWASGDILKAEVKSATVCKLWRSVASADLGAFV